jgi:alkyl sulfatase BDS1-like metallo-beta-lactamase superfamily hydrolase
MLKTMKKFAISLICFFLMTNIVSAQDYPGFSHLSVHQHKPLARRRVTLASGVYAFIGYSSSNFGVVASKNGYILIDAGDNVTGNKDALTEIKKLAPGPLQAIILTHSHPDHRNGADAFLEGSQGKVPIWGHPNFGAEQHSVKGLEKVTAQRFVKQFGISIPDSLYTANFLIPRFPNEKSGTPASPNQFAKEGKMELMIDGIRLELYTVPSETQDHLAIWLPDQKVLFGGDAVYGCFPNLYPIRGGVYRDVERWANGVRRLMEFKSESMMLGHVDAIVGANEVSKVLTNNAEAIEYVYTETIRGMNEGKTPDELAMTIQLPMPLRKEPYLGEFHGAIPWAIREIYAAKLGWFDGNPTNLVPLTPLEEAERIANLAGGKKQLLSAAREALREKDYRWAAKVADYLILLGEEKEAKPIKSDALEAISHAILPMTGKNYLLRSALDLRKE